VTASSTQRRLVATSSTTSHVHFISCSYASLRLLRHRFATSRKDFILVSLAWVVFSARQHWLKINERIEYIKLLSLTYKVLTTSQPDYLHNLISVHSACRTRSSSTVTLARPSVSSSFPDCLHGS